MPTGSPRSSSSPAQEKRREIVTWTNRMGQSSYRFLLQLFLQVVVRLDTLGAHREGPEAEVVPRWVSLVDTRTVLGIGRNQHHAATQRTHLCVLCVHLVDVGNATTQHVHRDVVSELVAPISCFNSGTLHLVVAVSWKREIGC